MATVTSPGSRGVIPGRSDLHCHPRAPRLRKWPALPQFSHLSPVAHKWNSHW
jgi:hypothetical protein